MNSANHRLSLRRYPNFSAGPSALPSAVIERMQAEMFDYQGKGVAIFEISHRSQLFYEVYERSILLFKELLAISDNHQILFIHGGSTLQFTMVPLNFMLKNQPAAYIDTGFWSTKAMREAANGHEVFTAASSRLDDYRSIPNRDDIKLGKNHSYLHITSNNTLYGTQYQEFPKFEGIPLIADMSSDIFSRPLDFNNIDMCYGCTQKNIGISGVGFAVISDELLARTPSTPYNMLKYSIYAKNKSMFNTPNTLGIYVCSLVLEWIKSRGGVAALAKINEQKARLLYDVIDRRSHFYQAVARKEVRSKMNVVFKLPDLELEQKFLNQSTKNNLLFLKGHRAVGGIRASIYNAMPLSTVQTLVDFMIDFEQKYA